MDALPRLTAAATTLGVPLDEVALGRFARYRELLLAANARFNLTRVTDPDEIETRLFADALALLPLMPPRVTRLLDIGSGGGLPGMALAIARPDLRVDLLDATGKKVRFLEATASELELGRVTAIQGRAEEFVHERNRRGGYEVVTARAVARLVTLAELTLPFVRRGGVALLPKGSAAADELDEARYAIGMLGGRPRPIVDPPLKGTRIVVIEKVNSTPAGFPRRTGVPGKSPLTGTRGPTV